GEEEQSVRLWETWSGRPVARLEGHRGVVHGVAFAPGGRTLASASADTTLLLWDLLAATGRKGAGAGAGGLKGAWDDLAGPAAGRAYGAFGPLAWVPGAVAFLGERLGPATAPDARRVRQRIADLDGGNFALREKASRELAGMGAAVEPALREVLAG